MEKPEILVGKMGLPQSEKWDYRYLNQKNGITSIGRPSFPKLCSA
jgi:hypothetical protein